MCICRYREGGWCSYRCHIIPQQTSPFSHVVLLLPSRSGKHRAQILSSGMSDQKVGVVTVLVQRTYGDRDRVLDVTD